MKIIESNLIDRRENISIQKDIFLNKIELSISVKSKKIGVVSLKKEDNRWNVERIYSDMTYDRNGQVVNRLYKSAVNSSIGQDLESIKEELTGSLKDVLKYLEKNWQNLVFMLRLTLEFNLKEIE